MGKTIGELMEEMRIKAGAQNYKGHDYLDLARFDENTRHMIIFDVLTHDSPVGFKGDRMRMFLSDTGYQKALENQERGNIKILSHARVIRGDLSYDRKDQVRYGSDPLSGWQTADEYLSGNVRQKLRAAQRAAERDPAFAVNVEALKAAQPKDLDASEIEVRLGATWIDKEYIRQFMYETFDTPRYLRGTIDVNYSAYTAEWQITGKTQIPYNNIAAYTTYGTDRANAYRILEDSLNLRDVRIYDTVEDADGKERRVLNAKETTLAAQKQQAIRDAFKDWIWRDPERRQALVRQYNEEMNSTRPREYDGSHIVFSGMNPEITLREHQKSAIAHVLYGGNTLLAHEVGAGKTFEMVAAAMESKRLGLCQKSIFVVPNHLTEQWASEFLRLYPSANILVTTKKDFETHRRKKFCARIATGDYDAIIIGHSQFERIPISKERQERLLQEQIAEITEGISEVESSGGERFTVKQLERTKRGLEARLEKLQADHRKDDVITFEQLGVDRLFVDEAHNYKNLFLYTKMRNVAGLSTTDAQKSSDMFAKCRYMDEITGNRGVVFATGTPVSNSMTELYNTPLYLIKSQDLVTLNNGCLNYYPIHILAGLQPAWAYFAAVTALHLSRWYGQNTYCGKCGNVMEHSPVQRALICNNCGNIVYPQIAPVVIVAVVNDDKLLLTKYSDRTLPQWVLISGFVEIGETIEDAARREVYEETGIKIKDLQYFGSQPWGLSGSVIMGYIAKLDGSDKIHLDCSELAEALWHPRSELPRELANTSITYELIEALRTNKKGDGK